MCGFVVCECGASGGCVPWCGDVCVVVSHGLKCAALVTACRVSYRVIRRRRCDMYKYKSFACPRVRRFACGVAAGAAAWGTWEERAARGRA